MPWDEASCYKFLSRTSLSHIGNAPASVYPARSGRSLHSYLPWICLAIAIGCVAALGVANSLQLPQRLDNIGAIAIGGFAATLLTVIIWPELTIPIIFVVTPFLERFIGAERVRYLVFIKLLFFSCAAIGIIATSLRNSRRFQRVRTPADLPALALVGYTACAAVYSYLVAGYDVDWIAVTGYHLAQFALYHFLVTITLSRPEAFRRAAIIVVVSSSLWIIPSLLTPGRHGADATTWLLVVLCYSAVQRRNNWQWLLWLALPVTLLCTITSGYRTLWIYTAGQLFWMAFIGLRAKLYRLTIFAATLFTIGLLGVVIALITPDLLTPIPAAVTLRRFEAGLIDGGYRLPEARAGLEAFLEKPVAGYGIGYQTPDRFIDTMGYMPVGPIYHVYYISYLVNEGIIGLLLLFWYFFAILFSRPARLMCRYARQEPWAAVSIGLQAALIGAMLGAFFSGPSDGHWTWGILGAAAMLPAMWLAHRNREEERLSPPAAWGEETILRNTG
jgi:hypothetical protein